MESFYPQRREADEASHLVGEVLSVFVDSWSSQHQTWPYEFGLSGPGSINPKRYSYSTSAMILFSLATVLGRARETVLLPLIRKAPDFATVTGHVPLEKEALESILNAGTAKLVSRILEHNATTTMSSTFGDDDPLTLIWCHELLRFAQIDVDKNQLAEAQTKLQSAAKTTLGRLAETKPKKWLKGTKKEYHTLNHAFLKLKAMQLWKSLSRDPKNKTEIARLADKIVPFFEDRLHRQLSYHTVPDSRFDPAELAFCIEGGIIYDRNYFGERTIKRAFEVLTECQEANPYWRPLTPFIGTQKGFALFPVSVEVANSLIRSANALDGDEMRSTSFAEFVPQFRRYSNWLRARVVRRRTDAGVQFCGWHSEHLGEVDRIHLWETSQVVLYLMHYAALLAEHGARAALIKSGLSVESKVARIRPLDLEDRDDQWAVSLDRSAYWKQCVVYGREPLNCGAIANSKYATVRLIGDRFVDPRPKYLPAKEREKIGFTLLLAGPPGSGKTSLCKELAACLGWRFINVTVSDFLAGGAAEVEARAKAIFEILSVQTNSVILLDEIDHFLLDRESTRYQNQQGIFQFMTPGMLTKLQEFRNQESSILVVTTNFLERIDTAIRRPGRFDEQAILLPPGLAQRRRIFLGGLRKAKKATNVDNAALDAIARATVLFSREEVLRVVADTINETKDAHESQVIPAMLRLAKGFKPALSLKSYKNRMEAQCGQKRAKAFDCGAPTEEFFLLLYLLDESGIGELNDEDREVTQAALQAANNDKPVDQKNLNEVLAQGGISDASVLASISGAILKWKILKTNT